MLEVRFPPASSTCTVGEGEMPTPATAVVGCCANATFVAVPTLMLNGELVVLVSVPLVAASVYPLPALSIERVLNVAVPLTAATVLVPASVPLGLPALVPMATVTFAVLVVRLPAASRIWTVTAGVMVAVEFALAGWTPNASLAAAPGVMLNELLVEPVTPALAALSVYPLPVLSIDRPEKVATPLTAATVVVPLRVPPAGLVPIERVTLAVLEVRLPNWSRIRTVGAAIEDPDAVFVGWVPNASDAGTSAVMLNALLVALATLGLVALRV